MLTTRKWTATGAVAAYLYTIAIHLPVLAFYYIPISYEYIFEFVSSFTSQHISQPASQCCWEWFFRLPHRKKKSKNLSYSSSAHIVRLFHYRHHHHRHPYTSYTIQRCLFHCELFAPRTCLLAFFTYSGSPFPPISLSLSLALSLSLTVLTCWDVSVSVCVWLMQWICDDGYIPYVFTSNYGKEIFLLCRHDPRHCCRRCRRPRYQSRMLPQCFIDMWMHENKNRNMELPMNCAASSKTMSSMRINRNCNFIFLNSYTMPDAK